MNAGRADELICPGRMIEFGPDASAFGAQGISFATVVRPPPIAAARCSPGWHSWPQKISSADPARAVTLSASLSQCRSPPSTTNGFAPKLSLTRSHSLLRLVSLVREDSLDVFGARRPLSRAGAERRQRHAVRTSERAPSSPKVSRTPAMDTTIGSRCSKRTVLTR
jgi:hypothetical protein